eukprot:1690310-Prymnesium_polylepis.1
MSGSPEACCASCASCASGFPPCPVCIAVVTHGLSSTSIISRVTRHVRCVDEYSLLRRVRVLRYEVQEPEYINHTRSMHKIQDKLRRESYARAEPVRLTPRDWRSEDGAMG